MNSMMEDDANKLQRCIVENSAVVWLHSYNSEDDRDFKRILTKLRPFGNMIATFTDVDDAVDYMDEINCDKFLMIISVHLDKDSVLELYDLSYAEAIYFSFDQKFINPKWMNALFKIKGISNNIELLCLRLERDILGMNDALTPITNIFLSSSIDFDSLFMYAKFPKEELAARLWKDQSKSDLVTYCRFQYSANVEAIAAIDDFDHNYPRPSPVEWYTRDCFFHDLHKHIVRKRSEANPMRPFVVYRAQSMPIAE